MARAAACCVCVRRAGTFQYSERTVPFPASSVSAVHQILFLHGVPACRHHLRVGVQSEPGCSSPFYLPTLPVLVLVARPCPVLQTSFLFDIPKRRAELCPPRHVCVSSQQHVHVHAHAHVHVGEGSGGSPVGRRHPSVEGVV